MSVHLLTDSIKLYKDLFIEFVGDKYEKQFNRVTKTTTCIVRIFSYVWTHLNQHIFQFEKRIEFVCPFYAADFVPPYPKSRTLLKDFIYCCHDQCCNEVNKYMNKS